MEKMKWALFVVMLSGNGNSQPSCFDSRVPEQTIMSRLSFQVARGVDSR